MIKNNIKMKYLVSFLMMLLVTTATLFGQIDFAVGGAGASPSPIAIGDTTVLEASIAINSTSGGSGQLGVGCLQVLVSFDESKVQYVEPIYSGPQPFIITGSFTWLYVPGDGIYGSNNTALFDGDGGSLLLSFRSLVGGPTSVQFSTNLSDVFNCTNSNDGTNDGAFATVVLPVKYKSITTRSERCVGNQIIWSTSSEVNNSHFEIEVSKDSKNFVSIGEVKGTNKSTGSEYKFIDLNKYANGQTVHYRLKQFDFDGRFEYSELISTRYSCDKPVQISVSPNPARDEVRVEFVGADPSDLNAILLDGNGAYVKDVTLNTGVINKLDISSLSPGVYTIQVSINEEQFNQRFIKVD